MKSLKYNRNSKTFFVGIIVALFLTACDSGFEELNRNPNAYTEPDFQSLFTTSLIRTVGTGTTDRNRTNMKYLSGAMQFHATLQSIGLLPHLST